MSESNMFAVKDFEQALKIGRPPNITRLSPNSKALIVSGKFIDRAMLKKGKCMAIAANGRNYFVIRGAILAAQRTNAALLAQHVPSGSTVLTKAYVAAGVVALHDCHVVASDTASNGVLDQKQRRKDLKRMLAGATPLDERRALLRKYEITHYLAIQGETLHPWLERLGTQAWQGAGVLLIALHVE